jgi:electron transport complex protein RnfG
MVDRKTVGGVVNITLRLLVICLVVAALTALVYAVTVDPIAKGESARKESAIRGIFAEAASFAETELMGDGINAVYRVSDGEAKEIGWCVDYTGSSEYGGAVNMMIGVGRDGKVLGLQVISHGETFMDRYLDENGRYTGAELSAGATFSYNAIRNAIAAVEAYFAPMAEKKIDPRCSDVVLETSDVQLLFAEAVDHSERKNVDLLSATGWINTVRVVRDGAGAVLGYCVHYTTVEAYSGYMELLLAVADTSDVTDVLVLETYDDRADRYLDENSLYTGVELLGGATRSYHAIRNAMQTVEALQLGGAA